MADMGTDTRQVRKGLAVRGERLKAHEKENFDKGMSHDNENAVPGSKARKGNSCQHARNS